MPMEANDSPHHTHQRTHAARDDSLRIDASGPSVGASSSLDSPETPASARPRSSTTTHFNDPPHTTSPASAPPRASRPSTATSTKSAAAGGASEPTGKRKRSRVTPDQLIHLERIFAQDRSPTAARRKEISEMLGMQERQTQIWFQNRRAKAKNLDGKGKANRSSPSHSPPDTPPETVPSSSASSLDHDRHMLIHEDHPVNFLPCDDLTIGNWRRIASVTTRNDLLAYSCDAKRVVAWYIQMTGFGFKMEIPYEIITRIELTHRPDRPELACVSFFLSGTPSFFLETVMPTPHVTGGQIRIWQPSQDWTEGGQASRVRRHDIVGPYGHMTAALRNIPLGPRIVGLGGHGLYRPDSASALPLQPPQLLNLSMDPPMPVSLPQSDAEGHSPVATFQGRKRSLSGPPPLSAPVQDSQPPVFSAPSAGPPASYMQPGGRPSSLQFNVAYPTPQQQQQQQQYPQQVFRFAPPPIPQQSTPSHSTPSPMEYSGSGMPQGYPSHMPSSAGMGMPSLLYDTAEQSQEIRGFSSSASSHSFGSDSPPLLTQPFTPNVAGSAGISGGMVSRDGAAVMPLHNVDVDHPMSAHYSYGDEPMSAESMHSDSFMHPGSAGGELPPSTSSSSLEGALGLSMSHNRPSPH